MTELRRMLPKKIKLTAAASVPNADKLGVFSRDVETVNNKPLYVSESDPEIAIWWAPPDYGYPTGLWLVGLYDKRGQETRMTRTTSGARARPPLRMRKPLHGRRSVQHRNASRKHTFSSLSSNLEIHADETYRHTDT